MKAHPLNEADTVSVATGRHIKFLRRFLEHGDCLLELGFHFHMDPARGIEPQLTDSKSAFLPLEEAGNLAPSAGIEPA